MTMLDELLAWAQAQQESAESQLGFGNEFSEHYVGKADAFGEVMKWAREQDAKPHADGHVRVVDMGRALRLTW